MKNTGLRSAEEESVYLLEYEKQKIQTCAKSFEELANVFVYLPGSEKKEDDENKLGFEQDRKTVLWKN